MAVEPLDWRRASRAISRAPMYFGPPHAALFGWYHTPPIASGPAWSAAVLCPSIGHEYTNAHRGVRHLADELAACGVATLRFDYIGTGDSAEPRGPASVEHWVESVCHAAFAVRACSGCDRVGIAGVRFGATLAALAARDVEFDWLTLWAPYTRGRVFVRELKALALAGDQRSPASQGALEAGGFLASAALQRELAAIDLTVGAPRAARVLIVERDDRAPDSSLETQWRSGGANVTRWTLPGFADMILAPHNTIVPTSTLRTIAGWVAGGTTSPAAAPRPPRARPGVRLPMLRADGVYESTIRFGHGSLFGIVAEPSAPAIDPRLPAIVLPNAGSAHHAGPNRLYVDLARALARAGFRSLRFDLPGLGDSVVDDDTLENGPYPPRASHAIDCGAGALANLCGARTFVVMGLCSGAHAAFHAALDLDEREIVEALLINPLTFAYRPGMPLDAPADAHSDRWQRYRRSMTSLGGWRKLLRRRSEVPMIARDVATRAALVLKDRLSRVMDARAFSVARTPLAVSLESLAHRGRHVTLVCARFDPGHDLLMLDAASTARRLTRAGQLTTWHVDDANHTFDASAPRAELIQSITEHLTRRYVHAGREAQAWEPRRQSRRPPKNPCV